MRIVSLLASATEVIFDLGLQEHLVGISHECDYPPEALSRPRVSRPRFNPAGLSSRQIDQAVRDAMMQHGSVYQIDDALLARLQPDLIVAQAVCEVCAVPTSLAETVSRALGNQPRILSLDAHRLEDIFEGMEQIGRAAGAAPAGRERAGKLRQRVRRVREAVKDRPRPRVLSVEWLDPPFAPGHWTPEMVTEAGGENLLGDTGRPSRQVRWSDMVGLDPDVLLVMPCGYGLDQSIADAAAHAEQLHQVAPRAVEAGRAFVVDGSAYFNRSGPRAVDGIEILGALLHPAVFPELDLTGKAASWDSITA